MERAEAIVCGVGSRRRQSGSGEDAGCAKSEDRGAEEEAAKHAQRRADPNGPGIEDQGHRGDGGIPEIDP